MNHCLNMFRSTGGCVGLNTMGNCINRNGCANWSGCNGWNHWNGCNGWDQWNHWNAWNNWNQWNGCGNCDRCNACNCRCRCRRRPRPIDSCCGRSGSRVYTISGVVTGVSGPVENIALQCTVNGQSFTTYTNEAGRYFIDAPCRASVLITLGPIVGVISTPSQIEIPRVCESQTTLNITLTPVVEA